MNNLNTKRIAGVVAILATVAICGGTLSLADHYARSTAGDQEYLVAAHQSTPAGLKRAS